MTKFSPLHLALLTVSAAITAMTVVPSTADAAGTIVVEQKSQIDVYGSWRLHSPAGTTIDNRKKDRVMTIEAQDGKYLLTVQPPEGAVTTIRFYDGSTLLNTTEGTQVSFTFGGNGTLRAEISYHYEGIILIESTPSGAQFELKGPQGVRRTGTTPATFTRMPPLYFTASFSPIAGCQQPKPQSRVLRPGAKLVFSAKYVCLGDIKTMRNTPPEENRVPQRTAVTPFEARIIQEQKQPNVQLFHSVNQSETVAGSTVYVTVGVRNISRTTLRNVVLSEQFDPMLARLPGILPNGGTERNGNTAVWNISAILAGQSFAVRLPVQIQDSVRTGDIVRLTARVSGTDIHAPNGELLSKKIDIGVAALPKTGEGPGTISLLLFSLGALIMSTIIRRRQIAAVVANER